jgi:hypothetical protein
MPRFRLKTMFIVFVIVALWLSTLAGYAGSEDVRAFIWLACILTSGVAALGSTGRRRAFWLGFFGTMLLTVLRGTLTSVGASMQWTQNLSRDWSKYFSVEQIRQGRLVMAINTMIIFVVTLAAATVIGLLCVYVYDQFKRPENH